ncbi:MAG: flagellar biosynthesis protein FliQ [Buchnera aphidicola (Tetraneura akinire)]|nr:flagellar biosynthesis protein FliQ [Buchnera sp. (in: enterobacteria)]
MTSTELVMSMFSQAMKTSLLLSAPALVSALITGLFVSIFQASTQLNEQTLSFIPKLISVIGSIFIFGPWMLHLMINYINTLFINLPAIVHQCSI